MPRDITVTLENGQTHVYKNAPDDVTPDAVAARAQKEFGVGVKSLDGGRGTPAEEPSAIRQFADKALDVAGDVGRRLYGGFGKAAGGLIQLGGMGPDRALLLPDGSIGADKSKTPMRELGDSMTDYWTQFADKSKIKGYAGAALEGIGGVALPVGGPIRTLGQGAKMLVTGAASGLGGEAADKVLQGAPLARPLGSLLGGLAGAGTVSKIASSATPQAGDIARQALEGLTPGMLKRASDFQARATQTGVKVDLAQALEAVGVPAGNLRTVRDVLANSQHGDQVQNLLRNQPTEMELLSATQVGGMPGKVRTPDVAANNVQEAATKTIDAAKSARSVAVRPFYEAAGELPKTARKDFADAISNAMIQPGVTEPAAKAMQAALAKLKAAPGTGSAMTHSLDFDTLIAEMTGAYKGSPMTPVDPRTVGQLKRLAGELNAKLKSASPELAQGEALYAQQSHDIVDPLKQGLVGQLATPRGYRPDVQASMTKLNGILSNGEDAAAGGVSGIRTLASNLKRADPEAFPDAFKTYVSGKVASAFPPTLEGQISTDPKAIQRLSDGLGFGDSKKFNGLRQATAEIAKQYGVPEADAVRGLENFAQITKATLSRPDKIGGMSSVEIGKMGGENKLSTAVRTFGMIPFERPARAIEAHVLGQTFRQFDTVLTSPEGAKMLAELGKVAPTSAKAQMILQAFTASLAGGAGGKTSQNTQQ